ncbi:MAG: ABC transporter permease [Deltaproteobacteria bacterium]|nr:ABC transporter permease [Deltaproteobacteria bacterium]
MSAGTRDVSAALLLRDAARAARRWHTYALRAAFSAFLFGIVLAIIWLLTMAQSKWFDPTDLAWAARGMFVTFGVVQVLLAALIAPFAVARAVIEEREQNTIDLLMLTHLEARQILVAKVLARVLVLLSVILGALPVLGLVVTLGGVSVVEVVAVTVHAMTTVLVLGVLGAFFAVFTRSPVIASLAALFYGFLVFVLMPMLYTSLTGDYTGMAHFSPLYGGVAQDWWALLPLLSYAPVIAMTLVLGARFYELRVSNASLRRFFNGPAWSAGAMKWGTLALVVTMVFVLPLGAIGSWYFSIEAMDAGYSGRPWWAHLLNAASRTSVWAWCVGLLMASTWLYLRVAMDMVMMADDMLAPARRRTRKQREVRVWDNPVAWREMRSKTWRVVGPALLLWMLVLIAIFQMGLWLIPGGLLGVGAVNAAAALVLTVWLGAGTIEQERREGTLEILLTSTMNAAEVVVGKALGIAVPTGLLLSLSLPMLVLGAPHLQILFIGNGNEGLGFGMALLKGLAGFFWLGGLWVVTLLGSMTMALMLRNPRHAYGVTLGGVGLFLLLPAIAAAFARGFPLVEVPARLLVPVLVARPTVWEMVVSFGVLSVVAVALFVLCCARLRKWGLADA